ncbi:MAG: hypothetical protein M8353_03130 [ANME-2 cluster archaeon]|nr:hypothetical protein [ANME-2 cluster archaeon]
MALLPVADALNGDCLSCHDSTAPYLDVNISAMNASVHANLNNGTPYNVSIDPLNRACWACHGNGTPPAENHSDGAVNATNPANYTNPLNCNEGNCHINGTLPGSNISGPSIPIVLEHVQNINLSTDIDTFDNCSYCHNQSLTSRILNDNDASNVTLLSNVSHYAKTSALIDTIGDCSLCHKNASVGVQWNVSDQIRHPVNKSAGFCRNCHGIGAIFHKEGLSTAADIHTWGFDWEGDGADYEVQSGQQRQDNEGCYACHNETGPATVMGITTDNNTRICEECHYAVSAGPFNSSINLRSDMNSTIPRVFNHINDSGAKVEVSNMNRYFGSSTNISTPSSCYAYNFSTDAGTCHGVSNANNSGGYYAFRQFWSALDNTMRPYRWTQTIDHLPNTSDCRTCHLGASPAGTFVENASWGYPMNVSSTRPTIGIHLNSSAQASDCWNCHVASSGQPKDFHDVNITSGGGPDCISCHDVNKPYATRYVDVGALNGSKNSNLAIHRQLNSNMSLTAITTTGNPNNSICWGCHDSTGYVTSGMGDRFENPYTCYDCHGGTPPYANVSEAPTVYVHFVNGSLKAASNASDNTSSCLYCHNASEMQVSFNEGTDSFNSTISLASHYGKQRTDLRTWDGGVNCSYCHQEPGNNFTAAMLNPTFNASVPDHSLNASSWGATSPNCTNASCHNGGWMHNMSLTKPVLVLENTTLCTGCHDGVSYPVTTGAKEQHNGSVNCTECHLAVKQDIHGVKYLQTDDTYSTSNTSVVNCVRCHSNNTTLANFTPTRPLIANTSSMFTHSDNIKNGSRWNSTAYWNSTNEACEYCHNDTRHSDPATGLIESIRNGQALNMTVTSTNIWCRGCHVNAAPYYNGTRWTPVPPTIAINNIKNTTAWDGSGLSWYNHSFMAGNFNDTACLSCHGNLLSGSPTTKEFVHRVGVGSYGVDCISCHDIGGSAPKINFTAMNDSRSIHQNIQNSSDINNPYGTVNDTNKICWACHINNATYPATVTSHADRLGEFNGIEPYTCEECHAGTNKPANLSGPGVIPAVVEHFYGGDELKAGNGTDNMSSCVVCHNLTEMKLLDIGPAGADPADRTNDSYLIAHYGRKRTDLRTWSGGVNCSYCHQAGSAFNSTSIMLNPTFNASVPDHSLNASSWGATSPNCTNASCHNGGWMHNMSLTKPVLVLENTTLCTGCHDGVSYPVTTGAKEQHNGSVNCTECHLAVKQDIHGVKYLQQDGLNFSTSNGSAVNCTTCHQGAGLFGAPTLGPLSHSNVNGGQRWDNYWTDNLTGCIYCHNDTKHTSEALGNLDILRNEPVYFTGMICSACHYNDSSSVYYNNITRYLKPIPPEILNGTNWNGTSTNYFNHSLSDYTDASCKFCHQNTSSVPADTPQMAHDVYSGVLANCGLCHDIGSPGATTHIDISNLSMHRNANISDGVNVISNLDCQECHYDTSIMLPGQVPARNCTECHVDNVTLTMPANHIVYNHRPAANISTTVDCEACHKNSLNAYSPLSTTDSDSSNISHYGTNTSLINTSNCVNCHMMGGTNSTWGNAPPVAAHNRTGNCTSCHSSTGLQVIDFHNNSLEKPLANTCVKCHTNQTNVTKYDLTGLVQTHYPDAPANKANTTSISPYTCELCHNVSTAFTGALHNSTFRRNTVNGVNGTCYECHSMAGSFTYKAAPVNHIDVLIHDNLSSVLEVNCTTCHNVTGAGIFHYAQWPLGEVQQPSWAGWTNGSKVNCTGCHVAYNNSAPFYAPPPTHSPGYTLDSCIQCHTQANNSTDPAYPVELHNVSGGDPTNCIGCHNEGNDPAGKTPPVNASALEAGIHENLNGANISNNTNLACYACHWTGITPPVHPTKDVYTPKICEDCHGTTLSFFSAPLIAEHRPGALDVETNSTTASCVVCHNNSVNTSVGSYTNITDRVSHYGTTQNLLSGVLNKTQNCTYCHYTIASAIPWGSPMDPRVTVINFNHSVYNNNTDCYYCHAGNQTPADFHDASVTGGAGKDCVSCHDIGGAAPAPKWLDVSAMNSSKDIHYDLNRAAIATTTLNPNNVRCWACHGDGDGTDAAQPNGHPLHYNAPKNCNNNNCHAVNQSIFGEPMVYEHFRYAETIDEDIETTAGCDVCHKNSLQSHNDNDVKSDVALVSHYGSTRDLINSSSCIYCHLDEDNGEKWGNAPDPTDNVTTLSETERESTLFMGEKWNLGNKYMIFFKDISIDGETAYVQLFRDDELINESFIHDGESYVFHDELTDTDGHEIKSIIISVNVTAVFRGNEGTNLIIVKGRTLKRIHSEWDDESCYACHVDNYTSEKHRYLVIDKDDDNTYYTELLLDFEEDDIDQHVLTPRQESTIVISKGHNRSWIVNGYNFTARDVEIHDETAFINFEVNGRLMEENVYDVGDRIEYEEDLTINRHIVEDVVLFGADVEYVFHGFEDDAVMLTNVRILSSLAKLIDSDEKIGGYNVSWLQVNDTFFVGGAPENLHVPPLNDGVDGGPDCVLCHDVSANFGIATVDAISTRLGGHAFLNENATNRTRLTDEIDKACWACHGDGTEPETHPADYLFPRECKSCHVQMVKPDYDAISLADVLHGEVEDCNQCHSSRTEFHVINVFNATPQIRALEVKPQIARSGDRIVVNFTAVSGWKMYITNMEYFIGEVDRSGTGTGLRSNDNVFDEQVEEGTFTIDTTGWERGTYVIYVHAMERDNDWGPVQAVMFSIEPEQHMIPWWIVFAILTVTGLVVLLLWSGLLEAPFIKGDITALPPKVGRGENVRIHATAVAGLFRHIAGAELFIDTGGEPGTGTVMHPDKGGFGHKQVPLTASINTAGLTPGIHTVEVRAMENSGKWGSLQTVTFEVEK